MKNTNKKILEKISGKLSNRPFQVQSMPFRKRINDLTMDANGFSLLGIIISMIAVSIMAAAAIPSIKGLFFQKQATIVANLSNVLINAESTYVNNNNKFAPIAELQSQGYLAQGLNLNSDGTTNISNNCLYSSIVSKNDTSVCISVNNSPTNNGQEISYALTIKPSGFMQLPSNYFDFYKGIEHDIPGSSYISDDEIEYVDPIALVGGDSPYNKYVGRSFYIGGASCFLQIVAYINAGRGFTHTYNYNEGSIYLYFIVEGITGNNAILSYANNQSANCNSGMDSSSTNNASDTYNYSYYIGGAFQSQYLPEVYGTVRYLYWEGNMNYVPIEPTGTEIEIPASYLQDLINLNQLNTYN